MKFEKLAEIALDHSRVCVESARYVLDSIKLYPCGDTAEHAQEMQAVAHFRQEAMHWYFRYKRACKQAERRTAHEI